MHNSPAAIATIHALPSIAPATPPSEEVINALYAALRQQGAVAAGIESMAVRAFEQNETHTLEDIANLATMLSEGLRHLALAITHLKPHE